MKSLKLQLSLQESNVLKGIALILLLIHHLFYVYNIEYCDITIGEFRMMETIGRAGKVCVAIFVFLSGYALGITNPVTSSHDIIRFYKKRFKKLFVNFWFIWLIFVPAGVLIFNRQFADIYPEPVWKCFLLDFFGLIGNTGYRSYNGSWWFYSCIMLLYIGFPLITLTVKRWPATLWLYIAASIVIIFLPVRVPQSVKYYLLTFLLGYTFSRELYISRYPAIRKLAEKLFNNTLAVGIFLVLLLIPVVAIRLSLDIKYALFWDTIVAVLIVMIYKCLKIKVKMNIHMEFVGRHSFNIFLFHDFILAYFPIAIYWSGNPLVILLSLLLSCIAISIALERLKKFLYIDRI